MEYNSQRLQSIDALRGFDMLFISGLAGLITAICALFPGGSDCWLATQMHHAAWDGLRHHDTIFPLFLFISGITFPFSYSKQLSAGCGRGRIYRKVLVRALVLCLLGIIYNGALTEGRLADIRVASVLGRIGVAWMLAAIIYMNTGKLTARLVIIGTILVGYWAALRFIPVPDAPAGAGQFTFEGNLCGYVDRMLLPGRLHRGTFDPEGILGVVPAAATALLGMLTGDFVRVPADRISGGRKVLCMLGAAVLMLAVGLVWSRWFPINKALWSSSFVCAVGGYSLIMLAVFYYFIDVLGCHGWDRFFVVIGMNSITIYMVNRFVPMSTIAERLFGGCVGLFSETFQPVMSAIAFILVAWLFLYFLYRHKVFLKV